MSRRIAIYLPSLEGGGAERVMLYLAKGFAQRGLCVDMVLVQAKGPYLELLPDGVRLIDLKARRTLTSLLPLLRYLRRECPDALVSTLPHANVVVLIVKKLFAKQLCVVARRENNFQMEYANAGFKDRLTLRLERRLLPFANAVVACSDGVADDLKRSAPKYLASHTDHSLSHCVARPCRKGGTTGKTSVVRRSRRAGNPRCRTPRASERPCDFDQGLCRVGEVSTSAFGRARRRA